MKTNTLPLNRRKPPLRSALHGLSLVAMAATFACAAHAQPALAASAAKSVQAGAPAGAAGAESAAPPRKDILLDAAPPAQTPAVSLVVTPVQAPVQAPVAVPSAPAVPAPAATSRRPSTPAQDAATASALSELALDLLRGQSEASGNAQANAVVSSLSVASALGMVYAGTSGPGARELGALMAAIPSAGAGAFGSVLPSVLDRLAATGARTGAFVMANRVWMDQSVVAAVPAGYAAAVSDRLKADGAVVPFADAAVARQAINSWVSDKTGKRILELMPEGSVTPTTRVVVTNAIYFKSKWAQPFDAGKTVARPFFVEPKAGKPVPTMVDERSVRTGTVDTITVFELPFAGNEFSLMVAMPPAGDTLDAFEKDLDGGELAGWSAQLKPMTCRFEMPKFTIAPASKPLKARLQSLGVKTVFGPDADLSAMLGKSSKGVYVDNVFHSATIVIDEQGGEAAAATGAALQAKSLSLPAPACLVNRPFIFAVVHKATGAPLFVGKVADPSKL